MENIFLLLSFIFGAIVGSFLNVVILRLPHGGNLNGRSHCPACSHALGVWDLFPILSFMLLKGRCRYCRAKISPRYWLIEFTTALLFALAWQYLQPQSPALVLQLFKFWLFESILLAVFVIDLEHYLILDQIIFPGAILAALFNLGRDLLTRTPVVGLQSYFISGLLGALALGALFFGLWYFSKGRWLGFGDVKLSVFLGLALGWPLSAVGLMLAVLLGGLAALFLLSFGGKTLKSRLPFGTFLALGALITLFYGEKLLAWYLAFLGF